METKQKGGYVEAFKVARVGDLDALYPSQDAGLGDNEHSLQERFWVFTRRGKRIVLKPPD